MQVGLNTMNCTSLFIRINFYHKLRAELKSGDKGDTLVFGAECTGKAVDGVPLLGRQELQVGAEILACLLRLLVGHGVAFRVVPVQRIQSGHRTVIVKLGWMGFDISF